MKPYATYLFYDESSLNLQITKMLEELIIFNKDKLRIEGWAENYTAFSSMLKCAISINTLCRTLKENNESKLTPKIFQECRENIYWAWLVSLNCYIAKQANGQSDTEIISMILPDLHCLFNNALYSEMSQMDLIHSFLKDKSWFSVLVCIYSNFNIKIKDMIPDFIYWMQHKII